MHTQPRSNFLRVGSTDLSVSNKIRSHGFIHAHISAPLHLNNLVDTFRMHPINLFTSRSQYEIFGQIADVVVVPESSSLKDLITFWRKFWYWSGNLFNCIELIILLELFSKCLQIRRNQFWRYVFNNAVCISGFIQFLFQTSSVCSSKKLSKAILFLPLFVKKPVVL